MAARADMSPLTLEGPAPSRADVMEAAMTLNVQASSSRMTWTKPLKQQSDTLAPPVGFEPTTQGLGMRPGVTIKIITSEHKYAI